ncbi:MAG TPA: helix-turn-helix transcriptional regulator [Bacteroidia bacterium]|nr:helix-turn-helix transcriptional regulator [Bacteroidia bacterium]
MRSKIAREILESTPEDELIFVSWYADLVVRIHDLLEEKGISQKRLAEKMGKTAPEISRWLSGDHNFTLKSLAKLQAELGEPLLYIPHRAQFQSSFHRKSSTTVMRKLPKKSRGSYTDDYCVAEETAYYEKLPA